MAMAHAIRTGIDSQDLYRQILAWAEDMNVDETLMEAITGAATAPPADYVHHKGWVLIALRNALWQLLHAPNLEEGGTPTPMQPSVEYFWVLCMVVVLFQNSGLSAC